MARRAGGRRAVDGQGDVSPESEEDPEALARETRSELRAAIEASLNQLFLSAVQAAMSGPWRDWSDQQPVGARVDITSEALAGAPDEVVAAVGRALVELEGAWKVLKDPPSVH